MRPTSFTLALRHARQQLIEHGSVPAGVLGDRLARSWQRSMTAGLLPTGPTIACEPVSSSELRQVLARNDSLLAYSRPVMQYLFEQVQSLESVVVLADDCGMLMHTLGDAQFMSKSARVALATGACWHEAQRGTNAIGTALAEQCAIEVHGAEHFLERNGFLTCAAAPIMSSCGKLLGILDVSGDQHNAHPHTLGLVNTAAHMIENRLLIADCRRHLRLHLHSQAEGIGTVVEGIIVLSDDGWIVGANRIGLALLGLSAVQIGAIRLSHVMDTTINQLQAQRRRRAQQLMPLHLHDGTLLFVQLQGDTANQISSHFMPVQPPHSKRGVDPADALAALDTGDARWRSAADKLRRVLDKDIPVLIQGESGVGKEYLARAAHESSQRRHGQFVAINCGAIPEHLIEAELFGYAPGAFTGARKEGSPGRLRQAHGGTLFLDEIGDMPLAMQTRLLRVLQERSVTPLGSGSTVAVDFALLCATHCKLREAAEKGVFRIDLYYRINGLTVQLPALRERTDFSCLVDRVLRSLHPQRDIYLAHDLMERMRSYAWPGNLRQLNSVLRTASAMLDDHEICIDWQHLPDDIVEDLHASSALASGSSEPDAGGVSSNLKALSRSVIAQALEHNRGNISQAARALGISRQTLYRKLQR